MSQFQALNKNPDELRSTADVFSSVAKQANLIGSRFSSGGKFTEKQFLAGEDATAETAKLEAAEEDEAAVAAPEHDPNDRRTLYERLKEQKDAKQEVWEEEHKFKNQMDHWKLGEDDVAFEEERMDKLAAQRSEAERLRQESVDFYKLARESQYKTAPAAPSPRKVPVAQQAKPSKRPINALPAALRVVRPKPSAAASAASAGASTAAASATTTLGSSASASSSAPAAPVGAAPAPAPAPAAAAGASLLGLAYGSSDDEEGED